MNRTVALNILSNVSIASPCTVPWDSMKGDNRVRFCDECHLKVYNLSDMKAVEAAELVRQNEGRLCIAFYRRPDGTILTSDCPKGLRPRIRWAAGRIAASIAALFGIALGSAGCATTGKRCWGDATRQSETSSHNKADSRRLVPGRMSVPPPNPSSEPKQSTPSDVQLKRMD